MKWSPTGSSSHCLMMSPCLTEQGIVRTSMTLSAPTRFSVVFVVFIICYLMLVNCERQSWRGLFQSSSRDATADPKRLRLPHRSHHQVSAKYFLHPLQCCRASDNRAW